MRDREERTKPDRQLVAPCSRRLEIQHGWVRPIAERRIFIAQQGDVGVDAHTPPDVEGCEFPQSFWMLTSEHNREPRDDGAYERYRAKETTTRSPVVSAGITSPNPP